MSNMELDRAALKEAEAAKAANKDDKEIAIEDEDSSENDEYLVEEVIDYNERLVALKEMLTHNGHTLREILTSEKVKAHYVSPFSEENTMSIEDILQEVPKEDLHEVGTVRNRIFMPASFVQKWLIPTIRVRNALKDHGDKTPGGIETAMLFSIFDQSTLDPTKSRQQFDEGAHPLRALITCAQNANGGLIEKMRKGSNGIKNTARASLKQLEQVVQIPPLDSLYNMSQLDYQWHQETIAEAIQQYRGHTERDLNDLQLLREQTTLQASLIWEQQMQICDMNKAYLD